MLRPIAVGSALLLLSGCLVQPREASCTEASACDECLGGGGCGWCDGEARCLTGTSLGPRARGECDAAAWHFRSCSGTSDLRECDTFESCASCLAQSRCSWCAVVRGEGECTAASCGSGVTFETQDACGTTVECADYGYCTRCARDAGCAWYDGRDTSYVTEVDCDYVGLEDDPYCEPWP